MVNLTMLVGLPCSLKSEHGKMLSKETGAKLFSSGAVRKETPGATEREIFDELDRRIFDELRSGGDCIVDSTNISSKKRKRFLQNLKNELPGIPILKVCVVMATPVSVCKMINKLKGNTVPEEVIDSMYKSWETPAQWEGWDEIWINFANPYWIGASGTPDDFVRATFSYDLESDHKHMLGGHCNSVFNHVNKLLMSRGKNEENSVRDNSLLIASLLHDCGKPIVKTYDDNGNALYYHHANVGSYESMFFKYDSETDPIYVSNLINYHMHPYDWDTNSKINLRGLAIRRWGCRFLEDIEILHGADVKGKDS